MYLGKCMYLQKWTIGHLGRAYFLDSVWGQDFSKYWEVAGAQSVILCEEKHVLLFACLQVAGICTTETEPQKKDSKMKGYVLLLFSKWTSPLWEKTESKGNMPHGSFSALF